MRLPYDVARCAGMGSDAEARLVWIAPPPIIAFECEFLITDRP